MSKHSRFPYRLAAEPVSGCEIRSALLAGLAALLVVGCGGSSSTAAGHDGGSQDEDAPIAAAGDGAAGAQGTGGVLGSGGVVGAGGMIGTGGSTLPGCGGPGLQCCDGNACGNGACCVRGVCLAAGASCVGLGDGICSDGRCGACGGVGLPCCGSDPAIGCTAPATTCIAGFCIRCGGLGDACCGGNLCTVGCCSAGVCVAAGGACSPGSPDAGAADLPVPNADVAGGMGGALGSGGVLGSGGIPGSGGSAVDALRGGAGGAAGAAGKDAAGGSSGSIITGGFATTINCSGAITVFLGMRPPQAAGSDVICWTSGSGAPVGDQIWTYDPATRLLVNQVNQLALKTRSDGTFEGGTSATDGTPITLLRNADGTYAFAFDSGYLLGIVSNNCQGALFSSVPSGSAGYQTSFTFYPVTVTTGSGGTTGTGGTVGSGGATGSGGAMACGSEWMVGADGFVTMPAVGGGCWHGNAFTGHDASSTITPTSFATCGSDCVLTASGIVSGNYSGSTVLGFNLSQEHGVATAGTVTPTGTKLVVTFSYSGPAVRLYLQSGSEQWCASLSTSPATIPYNKFTTACWDPTNQGTTYAKQAIEFAFLAVIGEETAKSFSMTLRSVQEL